MSIKTPSSRAAAAQSFLKETEQPAQVIEVEEEKKRINAWIAISLHKAIKSHIPHDEDFDSITDLVEHLLEKYAIEKGIYTKKKTQ